jgi:hypothetical protein
MAMAPMIFIPLMLLGGFFLSDDSIPDWLMWYVCIFSSPPGHLREFLTCSFSTG